MKRKNPVKVSRSLSEQLEELLRRIRDDPEAGEWSEFAAKALASSQVISSDDEVAKPQLHRDAITQTARIDLETSRQFERDAIADAERQSLEARRQIERNRAMTQFRKLLKKRTPK